MTDNSDEEQPQGPHQDQGGQQQGMEISVDDMRPMEVGGGDGDNNEKSGVFFTEWRQWLYGKEGENDATTREKNHNVPGKYRLVTETKIRDRSMTVLQFAVAASAISTKMLNPNYAIMVSPGAHPDSFPNTDPFDFNSATYFIPMCTLLGVAISSLFLGQISDRVGRKQPLVFMAAISCVGMIVKYYTKSTFWGFCISNFVFGFFLGNLPVGMAYIGDVFTNKREKEKQLGILVGNYVMGNSGGGMIAILMNGSGLFAPLWVGCGLLFIATFLLIFYFVESGDEQLALELKNEGLMKDDDDDNEEMKRPESIDKGALWNIIGGAVADNFGSTALFPLCLSPLALDSFYFNQVNAEPPQDPIMQIVGYQWLSVCVALMVVPSTMLTPYVFEKIGPSGTCVFGNCCTAFLTMALLFIGNITPATNLTFGFFVFFMYGGFPFTVFSQLTTGPMLDVIAPEDKIGFVQGLNNSAMNFGMALAPWLFGILADATTTDAAIWTGVAISFGAALINAPLLRRPEMGPPPKKTPSGLRVLKDDVDPEAASKTLAGEYVDPEVLFAINRKRALEHKQFIIPTVRKYEDEKGDLQSLHENAVPMYRFRKELFDRILGELGDPNSNVDVNELCELLQTATEGDMDVVKERTADVGQWIGDYLLDNGYNPHVSSLLLKQMVMTAFPSLTRDDKLTPENIEGYSLRVRQVMDRYDQIEEYRPRYDLMSVIGTGIRPQFYS